MNKFFAPALYKDNLRRNIGLIVVATIWVYLGGMFDVTMKVLRDVPLKFVAVNSMLSNKESAYMIMHLMLPIIAAVTVFSYLNKVNSSNAYNSWPMSRKSLYSTSWLSGFTICVVPLLINFLLMIAFCRDIPGEGMYIGAGNHVYTAAACFGWLGRSLVVEVFVYSIAVLGCVISGNGIIAFLTGIGLNFVIPALILCCYCYVSFSCWGFSQNATDFFTIAMDLSPWIRIMISGLNLLQCLIYLVVALAIAIFAAWVYHIRNMERATDSYVFEPVRVVIAFLLTFFITTLSGLLFCELWGNISYVPGFVIGFIVSQMVCYKTLRILNKKVLRNLVLFALIIAIVIVCSSIDVFGFSKKVPKAQDIKAVDVYIWEDYSSTAYNIDSPSYEMIEKTVDMHKSIVEHKSSYRYFAEKHAGESCASVRIRYTLTNDKIMIRNYELLSESFKQDAAFNEFKELAVVNCFETVDKELNGVATEIVMN